MSVSLLLVAACLGIGAPAHAQGEACAPIGRADGLAIYFASCKNREGRNFRHVVLAVHGWAGSCEKTFGTEDQSLFQLLGANRFFDFDCFAYDTSRVRFTESSKMLQQRLKLLRELGYERVMVITHSTGGVIFLQMLTDTFLKEDGSRRENLNIVLSLNEMPQLAPALLWATAINGLEPLVSFFSYPIGQSQGDAVLADLRWGNSDALQGLRQRLARMEELFRGQPTDAGRRYDRLRLIYYHGQGSDLVVKSIKDISAGPVRWFVKPPRDDLIETGDFHTINIGRPGKGLTNYYPGEIVETRALAHLSARPRRTLLDYAGENVDATTQLRQRFAFNAMFVQLNEAKQPGAEAKEAAIPLFTHMMSQRYPRAKVVDEAMADALSSFARTDPADDQRASFIEANVTLARAYRDYTVANLDTEDIELTFGWGEAAVVRKLADLLWMASDNAIGGASRYGNVASLAAPGAIEQFATTSLGHLTEFLGSRHDNVRLKALQHSLAAAKYFPAAALSEAKLAVVAGEYLRRKNLTVGEKPLLADLFGALAARQGAMAEATYRVLTQRARFNGKDTWLWSLLADDAKVEPLLKAAPLSPHGVQFIAQVARRAGASGNAATLADMAVARLAEAWSQPSMDAETRCQVAAVVNVSAQDPVSRPAVVAKLAGLAEAAGPTCSAG